MKGRTKCPDCDNEIMLEIPDDVKEYEVVCPKCNKKFVIKSNSCNKKDEECFWEEHGEPRKTILSSKKPFTNKPQIAGILLIIVFVLGITTAIFSESFIESSSDVFTGFGYKGRVEIFVTDNQNNSLSNVSVSINDNSSLTDEDGIAVIENVTLGMQYVQVSINGYTDQKFELIVYPFFNSYREVKLDEGEGNEEKPFEFLGCFLIFTIFSVFALLASLSALKRRHLDVAIAGSLIAIFSFGFYLVGLVLSIIAFILIFISREEFENGKKGKFF